MVMNSLSIFLSSSPPLHPKTHTIKPIISLHKPSLKPHHFSSLKTPPSILITTTNLFLFNTLPSLAAASSSFDPIKQQFTQQTLASTTNDKINLEAILVSIDDFFNKYPFFVSGVVFIWLIGLPLAKSYLQKYKYVSAIDAFTKLRDDPNVVMIDIRDKKSLAYLGSPNLKILNKSVVQVHFDETVDDDGDGFLNRARGLFADPAITSVIVLDNFDGNSLKVAEILLKIGFKETYAIKGGVRGKNGWQEIQEQLLPPSVHIRKKIKPTTPPEVNGALNQPSEEKSVDQSEATTNGSVTKSIDSNPQAKLPSSSPYTKYPDLKPPSSPTSAKPRT